MLLSYWLRAKQETGIKNQLIIQETKQKNALLSITIQQLDDGAETGDLFECAATKNSHAHSVLIHQGAQKTRAPHSIAHVRSLKKGTRVYCVRLLVKENGKTM